MPSAFILTDDCGCEHKLTQASPGLVTKLAKAAWKRKLEREVALGLGIPFGHRISLDHVRTQTARSSKHLTALEQGCLRSWATAAVWTRSRAIKYGYVIDDPNCPLCRRCEDTVDHRLWECEATADLRGVFNEFKFHQILEDPLLKAGILAHPAEGQRRPLREGGIIFWSRDNVSLEEAFRGQLFTDGSCFKVHGCAELDRAGWAVVRFEDGQLVAALAVARPNKPAQLPN